jgi:hypothetical protein
MRHKFSRSQFINSLILSFNEIQSELTFSVYFPHLSNWIFQIWLWLHTSSHPILTNSDYLSWEHSIFQLLLIFHHHNEPSWSWECSHVNKHILLMNIPLVQVLYNIFSQVLLIVYHYILCCIINNPLHLLWFIHMSSVATAFQYLPLWRSSSTFWFSFNNLYCLTLFLIQLIDLLD